MLQPLVSSFSAEEVYNLDESSYARNPNVEQTVKSDETSSLVRLIFSDDSYPDVFVASPVSRSDRRSFQLRTQFLQQQQRQPQIESRRLRCSIVGVDRCSSEDGSGFSKFNVVE
jgi:hypothetical protein